MTQAPAAAAPQKKHTPLEVLKAIGNPRVALMAALGFSSGLPFMLTAGTFGYWLRDENTSLKAIGFISWVGLAYSFKYLWAPVVDRVSLPGFSRLGRRRGWLLFTQILLGLGLFVMGLLGPGHGLVALGGAALFVAVASATQDIAVDALRIEAAEDNVELGLFTAAFQLAYRVAILCADALILILAQHLGWSLSYGVMAALMLIGIAATMWIKEPVAAERVMAAKQPLWTPRGLFDAVIGPVWQFFKTYGLVGLVILLMITLYRLPEFLMGPMATPFYHDLGFQKDFVGTIRGTAGFAGSVVGVIIGGLLAAWLGYIRGLVVGAILQGLAIASFALPAIYGGDPRLFGAVMFFDNTGVGAAGVLLVTYMSSLTTLGYTATQYALLSSAYTWVGKILKGFSGVVVESLAHGRTLMEGYALYFIGCGLTGLLALVICLFLIRIQPQPPAAAVEPSGAS